ncbi:MAG: hypothetical protein WCR51_01570 [Planctomycetia bacterium]
MKHTPIYLERLLRTDGSMPEERQDVFALLMLGLFDSLESGVLSPADAVAICFHAENCRFVGGTLKSVDADEVMERGTQLADLFDALTPEEAKQECAAEVAAMRTCCLAMLGHGRLVA